MAIELNHTIRTATAAPTSATFRDPNGHLMEILTTATAGEPS